MLRKIIAASALVLAMSGAAMAQSSGDWSWWHNNAASRERPVDRTTTGAIAGGDSSGLNVLGNTGAMGPCASNTPGPDANAEGNVNDHYCGK